MEDVRRLDEKRLAGRSRGQEAKSGTAQSKAAKNQFHNFQQRDIDYDALILQQLRDQ